MKQIKLALSVQLRKKEVATIYALYNGESYEIASETIWERAIRVLRERVLSLGLEFVGEMVGLDNMDYVRELPAFEVINLAAELGFINSTGKMRLSQANELVQHYRGRDIEEEMPQNESDTVIRACIQYILGYESSEISIEFGDFRNSLKYDLFEKQSQKMEMLINSPYFYKKTTVRTLINLIASTEGAEYETVSSNFSSIIEAVWESLTSDDRYFVGVTYSKYANKGELKYIVTFKQALEKVHGFDYVPENLRSLSFIRAAKNIKKVHYEFNNFYKEPDAVKTLERLGNHIPKPAIKESISATLMVLLGNFYGSSNGAEDTAYKILDKLDKASWKYYINECFPYDEDVLAKIAAGDRRTQVWCRVVKKYNLLDLEISDIKLQDLMKASSNEDKNKGCIFMLKKGIVPIILFIMVIVGCIMVNIKNTEALSPFGNTLNNYQIITEEFGENFSEFIKDNADIKIYLDKGEDTAQVQIGNKKIKLTKNNKFIEKIKLIGSFFIKQISKIENTLGKITKNTKENEKTKSKIDIIVDDFIEWLEQQN